jgi:NAD(P)-dependent dehydrogenase (short-subunit alcohol dehydrogenase family)
VVLSSTAALVDPPADWPHYLAAKAAAETLLRTAAREYPGVTFFVARPRRLRTSYTAVLDDQAALAPEAAAERIVRAIAGPPAPGHVAVIEDFPR